MELFYRKYRWLVSILLIIGASLGAFIFISSGKWFIAAVFVMMLVVFIYNLGISLHRQSNDTERILAAISRKDFDISPQKSPDDSINNEAVELYYSLRNENRALNSYKRLYEGIIDKLDVGFIILKLINNEDWEVFFVNAQALNILQVPNYHKWTYYKEKTPEFYHLVNDSGYQDAQRTLEILSKTGQKDTFSVRIARAEFQSDIFCVVSFESVQRILDRKEKHAWNSLMKVISHELLNTLTPINSLIQNLEYIANQSEITNDDKNDMRESLTVINSKSEQLLKFVESYRQIAQLPKPIKTKVNISETLRRVLRLFQSELDCEHIIVELNETPMLIEADETMMERVFVNLIGNAVWALRNSEHKKITVSLMKKENRNIIAFEDSGCGVPTEVRDKIFMPFFTTKKNGSGIGLSLSKSIVEAHGGYLIYKNVEQGSCFEVWM